MNIHEKIKVLRLFNSLTQEEMAEKLGYSVQGYAKIERGETDPTIGKLEEIANVLGVKLLDLLGLKGKNAINIAENCQYLRHNYPQNVSCLTLLTEAECIHELEKTRLLLHEKEMLIEHLNAEIALLKKVIELTSP
jgi:transcriptional regulator with XRE-family HTH domain